MQNYITTTLLSQRAYFRSGTTLPLSFRKQMLNRLAKAMHQYEKQLAEALWIDLHKSYE